MAHVSNFQQTNTKILLDLINADNSTSLPESAVSLGAPTAATEDPTGLITTVTATAQAGSGYSGAQTFTYNRVDLGFMAVNEPDLVIESEETTIHALIPYLNTTFGIQLTTADIVDGALPTPEPDVVKQFTITAAAGSLVWAKTVTLDITQPLVPLSSVLTVTSLDGLYAPEPVGD